QTLMNEVWPGIFVEENSLAFNISVLRKALGENAATPRYIETVPKRGYRFIGLVEEDSGEPTSEAKVVHDLARGNDVAETPSAVQDFDPPKARSWKWLAAATLGITSLVAVAALRYANHPKLNGEDTILLAGFTNNTGEP